MMSWLKFWLAPSERRQQADRETFQRRERELQERTRALERMAIEADVIQRNETPEWRAQ